MERDAIRQCSVTGLSPQAGLWILDYNVLIIFLIMDWRELLGDVVPLTFPSAQ